MHTLPHTTLSCLFKVAQKWKQPKKWRQKFSRPLKWGQPQKWRWPQDDLKREDNLRNEKDLKNKEDLKCKTLHVKGSGGKRPKAQRSNYLRTTHGIGHILLWSIFWPLNANLGLKKRKHWQKGLSFARGAQKNKFLFAGWRGAPANHSFPQLYFKNTDTTHNEICYVYVCFIC